MALLALILPLRIFRREYYDPEANKTCAPRLAPGRCGAHTKVNNSKTVDNDGDDTAGGKGPEKTSLRYVTLVLSFDSF